MDVEKFAGRADVFLAHLGSTPTEQWTGSDWFNYQRFVFMVSETTPFFKDLTFRMETLGEHLWASDDGVGTHTDFATTVPQALRSYGAEGGAKGESWYEQDWVSPAFSEVAYMFGAQRPVSKVEIPMEEIRNSVTNLGAAIGDMILKYQEKEGVDKKEVEKLLLNADYYLNERERQENNFYRTSWKIKPAVSSDTEGAVGIEVETFLTPEALEAEGKAPQKISFNHLIGYEPTRESYALNIMGVALGAELTPEQEVWFDRFAKKYKELNDYIISVHETSDKEIDAYTELKLAYAYYKKRDPESEAQDAFEEDIDKWVVNYFKGVTTTNMSPDKIAEGLPHSDFLRAADSARYRPWLDEHGFTSARTDAQTILQIRKNVGDWLTENVGKSDSKYEFYSSLFAEMTPEERAKLPYKDRAKWATVSQRLTDEVVNLARVQASALGISLSEYAMSYPDAILAFLPEAYPRVTKTYSGQRVEPALTTDTQKMMLTYVQENFGDRFNTEAEAKRFVLEVFEPAKEDAAKVGYEDMGAYLHSSDFLGFVDDYVPAPVGVPREMLDTAITEAIMQRFGLRRSDMGVEGVATLVEYFGSYVRENLEPGDDQWDSDEYIEFGLTPDVEQYYKEEFERLRPEMTEAEAALGGASEGIGSKDWPYVYEEYERLARRYFTQKTFGEYTGTLAEYIQESGVDVALKTDLALADVAIQRLVRKYKGASESIEKYASEEALRYSPMAELYKEPGTFEDLEGMALMGEKYTWGELALEPIQEHNIGNLRNWIGRRLGIVEKMAQRAGTDFQQYLRGLGYTPKEISQVGPYMKTFAQPWLQQAESAARDVSIDAFTSEVLHYTPIPRFSDYLGGQSRESFEKYLPFERPTRKTFRRPMQ